MEKKKPEWREDLGTAAEWWEMAKGCEKIRVWSWVRIYYAILKE